MTIPLEAQPRAGAFATAALEFGAVRARLAQHTSFSGGRDLALHLEPTPDAPEARRRQAETTDAVRLATLRPSLNLGGVHDVRPDVERAIVGASLSPQELLDVASTVTGARVWRHGLEALAEHVPTLVALAQDYLSDHSGLVEDVRDAIGESGDVLDTASPVLARIRAELRGAHERLVGRLREIMNANPFRDAVSDPVVTQRAGRYVIPIRADARGHLPVIVHDQSSSGVTLFVEPLAVVDMANRWRTLQADEQHEIERILRALSGSVGLEGGSLLRTVEGLARIDLARAKAALAEQASATAPQLVDLPRRQGEPVLRFIRARHPLLTGRVVPVDLELGTDFDVLLITGPNTGGKTVSLKTAGLLAIMAQAGLHIPADEGSLVGVFQRIQADIGDEQSLEQSLSTFSSHITRIVSMLPQADTSSLILLDELGAGTDPQEGAALGRALLDHFRARGSYVIATTHYPELKAYAQLTPRVENASVEFDLGSLAPTYRLLVGTPGYSNALAISERLGMPAEILEGARTHLAPQSVEMEDLLRQTALDRVAAEEERRRAERDAADAARFREQAQMAERQARRQRHLALEEAQEEAQISLAELRRQALRLQQRLQQEDRVDARQAVEEALALRPPPLPAAEPSPQASPGVPVHVRVGQVILVPRLNVSGRVLSVRDGQVELDVAGRRVRLPSEELVEARPATSAQRRSERLEQAVTVQVASPIGDVPYQLDLRGLRRDEAVERLEDYLLDAARAGLPSARIVHGKGSGAIRQAVRETLRQNRLVARFAPELDTAGGDGATVLWFA